MVVGRVGPTRAGQLVGPPGRRRRAAIPLAPRRKEDVDVPGYFIPSAHAVGNGPSHPFPGVVEMVHARVLHRLCPDAGYGSVVQRQHVNPDDAHADVGIGIAFDDRFLHRTGAFHALWSRGRYQGQEAEPVLVVVQALPQRLYRISQRRDARCFHRSSSSEIFPSPQPSCGRLL